MNTQDRSDALTRSYLNGHIDRASFLRRAAALGLAVSGAGTFASAAAAAGSGTLQAALTGEPDMLDPTRSQIYTGAQVYDNIFSKLIDIDEHQKFYGILAKSWKQVNPKTWVFDLVPGVKFHNGDAFTADDVKFSFHRAKGSKILHDRVREVVVIGPSRVQFILHETWPDFLIAHLRNVG
jgi:peptide/nickel transport system substrate-binding protein